MAIDGVYQKRVMNLTDDDIHHIKGSKKAYEHCSKAQQPGQKKMDIWTCFLLDWKVSIHELKNSPTSSLSWWWIWNLNITRRWEVGSQGKFNSVFLFFCISVFFVFWSSSWTDSFGLCSWREMESCWSGHLTIPPSTPAFIQPNILFHPFSSFFHDFSPLTLSSYHTFPLNCSSNQHFSIFLGGASNHPARL